jgi:hydroxyacylglutathione hydrolase
MLVEQIWVGNAGRNFNYLVGCEETGEALAVDPLDARKCLERARARGWTIRQIVNTHEHGDHTGGNAELVAATDAPVLAHYAARGKVPDFCVGLRGGDVIRAGRTVELEVLDTPGHTLSHVCLLARGRAPALICGDTMFNAGVGNCVHGGEPRALFRSIAEQIGRLPGATRVYPGHDYFEKNLRFTLDREPDNAAAKDLLARVKDQDPEQPLVADLALEQQVNVFLRLQSPSVIAHLREDFPDLPERPDAQTVFLKLRQLRNDW